MAKTRSVALVCALAFAAVYHLKQPAFVPPSARRVASLTVPAAAVVAALAPAFADEIGEAAKKLASASYPFLKEVDWNSDFFLKQPGNAPAAMWAKACDKAIVMGIAMDSGLLKHGVMAHHDAIQGITSGNPVLSEGEYANIIMWIGKMVASVPESTTMDVYKAFARVTSGSAAPVLMRTVNEPDARAAYAAFMEFKDVVKANAISPSTPPTPAEITSLVSQLDIPSEKLARLSHAFITDYDWTSDLPLMPIPALSAVDIVKGIDTMLVMGASMDGKLLQEAAEAHHKALESLGPTLAATPEQMDAMIGGIGKAILSVPTKEVLDVYNAMGTVVSPLVVKNLNSMVGSEHAKLAYESFMEFVNVVKKIHPA